MKHAKGRKGLLSFSTLGSPHVLETHEGEKRPPLLFYPREPARTWNTRRGEEASSPFLPSGARTYSKHTRGRRGLLSFSTLGSPHVLETHKGEKRPPLLFFLRAPARTWNMRRGEEASSPFLPSGARTYSKHTRGRRGLLSFSAIGGPRVLKTREREKRPPLLFFLRAPAHTWNTRAEEEASSKGLISFSAFGRPHVLEIFPSNLKPSSCYAAKPLVLEDTVALLSICLGMHLASIKFVSTDVPELCFEWQITRAEQYAKEAPCVSAARARSCSLVYWNKLRERVRVISHSRDFTIRRHDGNENVKNNNRFSRQNNNFAGASRVLYISLPFLRDYDVKLPNFTVWGRRKQATTKSYSLSTLGYGSQKFNSGRVRLHLTK